MENELKEYISKLIKYNEYEKSTEPVLTDEQCIQRFIELHEFGNKFIPRETLEKLQKEKYERLRKLKNKFTSLLPVKNVSS